MVRIPRIVRAPAIPRVVPHRHFNPVASFAISTAPAFRRPYHHFGVFINDARLKLLGHPHVRSGTPLVENRSFTPYGIP